MTDDLTTLVCLFHHQDQAQAAVRDLHETGIPQSSISLIGDSQSSSSSASSSGSRSTESALEELGIPSRDLAHLLAGVNHGGVIVAISAIADHVSKVESIFASHKATKIDEAVINDHGSDRALEAAPLAAAASIPTTSGETVIPVVEEEMVVGKRAVSAGGVRVYRRVVEIPVEESVTLREEHVTIDRQPVDRAVSQADIAMAGDRTIELTETAEEAVVGKSARVVEEVRLGKDASERTERIQDTVRRTEIEVEEVAPTTTGAATGTTRGGITSDRL